MVLTKVKMKVLGLGRRTAYLSATVLAMVMETLTAQVSAPLSEEETVRKMDEALE
jgi:hypothetical protein